PSLPLRTSRTTTTYDFYAPPLSASTALLSGDKPGFTVWLQNNCAGCGGSADLTYTVATSYFDYNPSNGSQTLIVSTSSSHNFPHAATTGWSFAGAQQIGDTFPTGYTVPAGHILRATPSFTKRSRTVAGGQTINFLYNAASGAAG